MYVRQTCDRISKLQDKLSTCNGRIRDKVTYIPKAIQRVYPSVLWAGGASAEGPCVGGACFGGYNSTVQYSGRLQTRCMDDDACILHAMITVSCMT